jgi:asparagine synthase (glutamine-hydrolysing)
MCGLAAIFAYRSSAPPVDRDELGRITTAMEKRGPDGDGFWTSADGRVGFGHRRLAILDPGPSGAQPMALTDDGVTTSPAADARLVITFNGEIYNFTELRAELEADGHSFKTRSDTEVLLHLYRRHGARMVEKLRGMYAFAIWDGVKRGILMSRDPFGIKPLYIADDGATIRVASQVKALRAGGAIDDTPDPAGHVGFFLFGNVPEPFTIYARIRAVEAGATEWFGMDGAHNVTRIDPLIEPAGASSGDRQQLLAAAMADTVRHHLVSDVPVGLFLSAGLDSATIAGHAVQTHAGIRSLTLAFQELAGSARDEAPLAETIAAHYGTNHTTRIVAAESFQNERDAIMAAMDQPTIDGVNTYFVAREAAAAGLKVALSGVGGDEIFGGYDTFREIPKLVEGIGWIPGLGSLGRGLRAVAGTTIAKYMSPKYASLFEYATGYGSAYLLKRGIFLPWELPQVLDPEFAAEGFKRLDPFMRLDTTTAPHKTPRAKMRALEIAWYMRNQLLRDSDWAGMAHSLEIRTPLVDVAFYRAVAHLECDKQMMARTPPKPLPDAVLNRPKTGFFVPVPQWMTESANGTERGWRGWAREVFAAHVPIQARAVA